MPKSKIPYDPPKKESLGVHSRGDGRSPQIRHTRPEVAEHVARMVIASNMDFEAAVSKMLEKDYPDATEAQIVSIARTLEKSPHVRRGIQKILEEIGCDNAALKKWLGLLWTEAYGANDNRWASAMRLLGEALESVKKNAADSKLPSLKLAGMEEGLSQMLGDAAPTNEDFVAGDIPAELEDEE
ncbi:MAG TPA: hypothetical protein VI386_17860 [Candidatus Sulfotelmatobacter sp.]